MPALRRARSGRGQNLQKSTQVEASGESQQLRESDARQRPSLTFYRLSF